MKYNVGDIITGTISGIKTYGIFIKFEDTFGFCHISNCSKTFISNINEIFKINDVVTAKVIDLSKDRITVSIKDYENINYKNDNVNNKSKEFSFKCSSNHKKTVSDKPSFDDMLKNYLKISDERLCSIGKRNQKHNKR